VGHALWVAAQWLIAPRCTALIRRKVHEQMAPLGAGRWLDVGCGPRPRCAGTLPGTLFGVDCAFDALREARQEGVIPVCASATALPFAAESFDGVVCFGLLHHLSEAEADAALLEMCRVTRPAGRVVLFDSVQSAFALHRPLAALLRAIDRGRHVRSEASLSSLLLRRGFHPGPRVTYSWTGLEGCWATLIRT
jgi:SAM-dependent methyltransferase